MTSTVDGVQVRIAGDGSPVLLLHGIGGSSASFDAQLAGLAPKHRVLAWDAPGYGSSADPEKPLGMAGYAALVGRLLTSLDAAPAHLVGVSWGGVIATRVALDYPEVVRSLVLADSTRGSGIDSERAAVMRARPGELNRVGAAEFARRRAPRLLAPGADPAVAQRVEDIMAGIRLPGYTSAAESMAETDHGPRLSRISVPTLVLVGEHDQVTGVSESRRLAASIPGARLEMLPGGHAANQEAPHRFSAEVVDFLSQVDSVVAR
ncbi:alpha/beta fold hydrolase [Amycolatopsis rubida]|uniref:Alpha/beta fold hydrolase n=1 Tax=Amycolatopsis rubida TaxID=112413 RepID=A0A1I5PX27_9PSEU|nr:MULTISPECIES: alpha/beta fold hydrolase [Amycolatopsis]MYW91105.1 alpha/beta fold hydrolase [Amycolatopsis rubida]NEC56090.1 alpha/beta fold hydrolase [Amycolatopsis rubida]OAP26320.1 3-oxoadipate enol-lactonase 2 [Amycolatopsis sp. M39]SFP38176.1 Pimeloyl-ACP methyl ester carboxylesterase [Amycolatopsis rubida]